jgi:diacylglycerol kinase
LPFGHSPLAGGEIFFVFLLPCQGELSVGLRGVLLYNISMEKLSEKKRFSIVARIKSTTNAWRGFFVFFKTTHNLWVQIFFTILAIYLGFVLKISNIEWVMIVFAIGFVIVTEALNTAFEIDIDLTSPNYHPYARDTKDIAAGAVLISAFIAGLVGLIIFLPKILALYM